MTQHKSKDLCGTPMRVPSTHSPIHSSPSIINAVAHATHSALFAGILSSPPLASTLVLNSAPGLGGRAIEVGKRRGQSRSGWGDDMMTFPGGARIDEIAHPFTHLSIILSRPFRLCRWVGAQTLSLSFSLSLPPFEVTKLAAC